MIALVVQQLKMNELNSTSRQGKERGGGKKQTKKQKQNKQTNKLSEILDDNHTGKYN